MQQLTRNIQAEIKQYHEACGRAAWRCGLRVYHFLRGVRMMASWFRGRLRTALFATCAGVISTV